MLAIAIAALKLTLLSLVASFPILLTNILINAVFNVVGEMFQLLFWVLLIRAILSWFSQGHNPIEMVLGQLTEPLLAPIRRVIPPMGGLDLSIVILLIGLQFLQILFQDLLRGF